MKLHKNRQTMQLIRWLTTKPAICLGIAACLTGSAAAGSLATEYNLLSKAIEVNFIAADQHVHQLWSWSDGSWHSQDLNTVTGAPAAATGSPVVSVFNPIAYPNVVEVDYVGIDQHIHDLWFNGSWHASDLNAGTPGAPNAAAGSALAIEYDRISNTVEVNYIGADQHVHQFWYNGVWHAQDLTSLTAATPATPGSPLVSEFNQLASPNTQEINYIGTDQHVHGFWFNGSWHVSDLTAGAGAPNASARSSLSSISNPAFYVDNVYYTGTDEHLHQLYFDGLGWHVQDMTNGSGAPNVASLSALYADFNQNANTLETNYLGTDQHVHQFWSRGPGPKGSWYAGDLNGATGAPDAASVSGMTGLYSPFSGAFEIDYIATDQHIHQFSFHGFWNSLDLTVTAGAPNVAPESSY